MNSMAKIAISILSLAGIGLLFSFAPRSQDAKTARPPGEQESQAAADTFYQAALVRFSALDVMSPGSQSAVVFAANTIKQMQLIDNDSDGLWLEIKFRNGEYSLQKITGVNFRLKGETGTAEVMVSRCRKRAMFWPLVN